MTFQLARVSLFLTLIVSYYRIARTLITKPKIILLDEATSALDSESEATIQEALNVIMEEGNATVIVIAHRLSTIINADIIAVIDKAQKRKLDRQSSTVSAESGSICESGSEISFDNLDDPDVDSGNGVVSLKHVYFSYPSRPNNKIFRDLTVGVEGGQTLAFVGPSGQGKSTIIQLVEEFYLPTHGEVSYNGDDLKDLNLRWYRNEIGLVSQEPTLFDTTITENIKFGMLEATQADIVEAAKSANAHDFITKFPDGYDTMVGSSSSSQISGGQKQRIAIARALLRKPKVLLLDEATSALDTESEKIVQNALDKIMASKKLVTIVIAHRLSTIRGADKIAYVSHGKVREVGTYEELMAKPNGHYSRLEQLQTLGENDDRAAILQTRTDTMEEKEADEEKENEAEKSSSEEEDTAAAKTKAKKNMHRARSIAKDEYPLFLIGSLGAILHGLIFPGQGFVAAYMIKVFYQPTEPCNATNVPGGFSTCQEYWASVADDMKDQSINILYLLLALIFCALAGSVIMFKAFGTATERINKRVRDETFKALVRQEVGWFDLRTVAEVTSQLSDDAAMIHSFSGEPIRSFVMTVASVGVGLITSFICMWEFALVALGILPFMAFGEYMDNQLKLGEDEGDLSKDVDKGSEGTVVVETLSNMRTVAALSMEAERVEAYSGALDEKIKSNTLPRNAIKGTPDQFKRDLRTLSSFCHDFPTRLFFFFLL
eukprot:scaffold3136_cov102-Cylindrotheca_fusiformis.AAC.6